MNKHLLSVSVALITCVATLSAFAQDVKGDAKEGEKKNAMCIGCHGIVGYQASFPEVYKVPKISGQNEQYIVAALTAYRTGERKHPTMRGIAESLGDKDIADLAAFYSTSGAGTGATPTPAATISPPARVAELLANKGGAACTTCHGANLTTPISPAYPKLAGQHADYLYVALKAYATSNNPRVGRANAIMAGQIKALKLDDLKELASYISSLPGELKTVPESRFRK